MGVRLQVSLHAPGRVVLPWNYSEKLMAFVYRLLLDEAPEWAAWLHSHGFQGDGKRFKLFTFSRLEGERPRAEAGGLALNGPIRWWVSSPVPEFVAAFGGRLLAEGRVTVGRVALPVLAVRREAAPRFHSGRSYRFRTLSPIVASTGARDGAGRFQKRFLSPEEPDFARVLLQNLVRKQAALRGQGASQPGAGIPAGLTLRVEGRARSRLLEVHRTQIRGWDLGLELTGDGELLALAYEAGLGEHNAAGCGMLRLVEEEEAAGGPAS